MFFVFVVRFLSLIFNLSFSFRVRVMTADVRGLTIPMQKGVSLFLSYKNMNKMNSLHHMKEHPKISNFLQFESQQ